MKRSPREDEAEEAEEQQPEIRQIGPRKLRRLLHDAESTRGDRAALGQVLREKIKRAEQHDNLHRWAFGVLQQMNRQTPEKLADSWEKLQFYVESSGLGERAKSAPRLELVAGTDEAEVEVPEETVEAAE